MYLGPVHGYGIEQPSTRLPDFGVYLQMEWGTVITPTPEALQVGNLVAFSLTDNQAVSGISRETRGLRAILMPTVGAAAAPISRPAGFSLTAIPALPAASQTYANVRGPLIIVQCYGNHPSMRADTDATGDLTAGGIVVPGPDTTGTVNGVATAGSQTQNESNKAVGFSWETVAINTVATFKGFVQCMQPVTGP